MTTKRPNLPRDVDWSPWKRWFISNVAYYTTTLSGLKVVAIRVGSGYRTWYVTLSVPSEHLGHNDLASVYSDTREGGRRAVIQAAVLAGTIKPLSMTE